MRRGSLIQLTAIALVAGAICAVVALAIPWLPLAAGREAGRIHFVFWFTTVICIGVFSVVALLMGRLGTVDDITGILVFLASDESLFATGNLYSIDGGMTI